MRIPAIPLALAGIFGVLSACRCIPPSEPPVPKSWKDLSQRWFLAFPGSDIPLRSYRIDRVSPELSIEEVSFAPLTQVERTSALSREQALRLIAERESRLLSIYDSRTDAYLEGLAAKAPCAKEYLPSREGSAAEGRLSYSYFSPEPGLKGGCTPERARFRTRLSWLYCGSDRSLYQIEESAPASPTAPAGAASWTCR